MALVCNDEIENIKNEKKDSIFFALPLQNHQDKGNSVSLFAKYALAAGGKQHFSSYLNFSERSY